jgi:spore coat protein A
VMMPGERYGVVIDFADPAWLALNPNFSGTLILKNVAKTPYPGGATPQGNTLGKMMLFRVLNGAAAPTLTNFDPAIPLRSNPIQRLVDPVAGAVTVPTALTRQLTLNEVMGMPQTVTNPVTGVPTAYPGGPLEILVNNTKWSGKRITGVVEGMYTMDPIPDFVPDGIGNYLSELPNEGDTEVWEIVNLTADAHPIHTHLVQFQIISRQNFDVKKYSAAYALAFPGGGYDPMTMLPYPVNVFIPGFGPPLPYGPSAATGGKYGGNPDVTPFLKGPASPPLANEAGWKDTVVSFPGQVTRFAIRWAPNSTLPGDEGHFPFNPGEGRGYVWHCHIIDHEDNEMMRPNAVTPKTGVTRTYIQGTDY